MAKLSGWAFPVEPDEATGRIKMVEDNDCVRQDIRLIVQTDRGERKMRPNFGAGLNRFMFQNVDLVLNLTTSGSKFPEDMRLAHLPVLKPEMCSYDPGSMNWGDSYVFLNEPAFLRQLSQEGALWQLDGTTLYTTVAAPQSRGKLLQTVDLNTGKRQAFCSKPGCTHQDESCGAWLDCESEIAVLPMEDGRLVLVYGRYGPLEEQGAEPSAAVELRDTSGVVLCPATPLPHRPSGAFYTDGIAVYYLWEQWLENGGADVSLIRIELDTAKGFGQASTAAFWQLSAMLSLTERCTEQGLLAIRWEHRMEGQTQVVQHRELCLVQWDGTVRTHRCRSEGWAGIFDSGYG